jgi:hypothetical protein
MPRDREGPLARFVGWWFRRRIAKALALNKHRRAMRRDGLSLSQFRTRLEIQWRAREVHPWDRQRGLSQKDITELFAKQCLDDTSAAIERLFCKLPEVEFIDFTVIDPKSSATILHGSVDRSEAITSNDVAPGMKLKNFGATYRLNDWRFEPLK